MRFGISVPNFGVYGDAPSLVRLAELAEGSGWDGFFVWDHISIADDLETLDPWALLGAVAVRTGRIAIGPMVTPLPRRRPWVVARQTTTVDDLSRGRLILGVGIGTPPEEEFGRFGEPTDARTRAEMLDEGLDILRGMWSGEPFAHEGTHYTVEETTFAPTPAGRPTIPIWVGATWPNRKPLRRAARFEGVFPFKADMSEWRTHEVDQLVSVITEDRGSLEDYDVVISGSFDEGRKRGSELEEAGATWFISGPGYGDSLADVEAQISSGP
ncbi:MAG: LLM class flavin-dependent oxidoreductase [Acidimicrobiia bacterium]|jgi:alkanesulfonate monooxygenase SsuD/methylene tetrahydromethanopterin reductase-like flavin-dependent oxidoreductase (luciferase family)